MRRRILYSNKKGYENEYFTITSILSSNTIKWNALYSDYTRTIQVSKDKLNWASYKASTSGKTIATLGVGEKLYIKGTNIQGYGFLNAYYNYFSSTKNFTVSGNITSLTRGDDFIIDPNFGGLYVYEGLFYCCTTLVSAEHLILPSGVGTGMYSCMFYLCTNLEKAPVLPATRLNSKCYYNMFYGCTKLIEAPELPALTLATACYEGMFYGCTKLNYIKAMFTTTPKTYSNYYYTKLWVYGVSNTGTFVKNSAATWTNEFSDSVIPKSSTYKWTVETAST